MANHSRRLDRLEERKRPNTRRVHVLIGDCRDEHRGCGINAGGVGYISDCIAKLPKCCATDFPLNDKTSDDLDRFGLKRTTEVACEFVTGRSGPPHQHSIDAPAARKICDQRDKKNFCNTIYRKPDLNVTSDVANLGSHQLAQIIHEAASYPARILAPFLSDYQHRRITHQRPTVAAWRGSNWRSRLETPESPGFPLPPN
jgi:hypothetical protein